MRRQSTVKAVVGACSTTLATAATALDTQPRQREGLHEISLLAHSEYRKSVAQSTRPPAGWCTFARLTVRYAFGRSLTFCGLKRYITVGQLRELVASRLFLPPGCVGLEKDGQQLLINSMTLEDALEAQTDVIRAEFLAMVDKRGDAIRPYVRQDAGTPQNKWTALDGSLDWGAAFLWEYGVRNEAVCAACPQTVAALEALPRADIPGRAPSAFFSLLKPRSRIPAHTGVTNTRAIIHLPLIVPPGCFFRVGGETRAWQEGVAFGFDDTIDHEAWNDSDHLRVVLIFDVWNPHLSLAEQQLLKQFYATADASKTNNVPPRI